MTASDCLVHLLLFAPVLTVVRQHSHAGSAIRYDIDRLESFLHFRRDEH